MGRTPGLAIVFLLVFVGVGTFALYQSYVRVQPSEEASLRLASAGCGHSLAFEATHGETWSAYEVTRADAGPHRLGYLRYELVKTHASQPPPPEGMSFADAARTEGSDGVRYEDGSRTGIVDLGDKLVVPVTGYALRVYDDADRLVGGSGLC